MDENKQRVFVAVIELKSGDSNVLGVFSDKASAEARLAESVPVTMRDLYMFWIEEYLVDGIFIARHKVLNDNIDEEEDDY